MRSELPNWESLQGRIDGDVALPGSPAYQALPPPFNARFRDVRPAAVMSCASSQDVAEATSFARRHGLELATTPAGASRPTPRPGRAPRRHPDAVGDGRRRVATVGAGARRRGLRGPAGTRPHDPRRHLPAPVGVAGLTLGGGLGILGRRYGVTSDHLIGAEVVLADGRILRCDDHHEADLFWALRGAGAGNFGVVTTLVFRACPPPRPPPTSISPGRTHRPPPSSEPGSGGRRPHPDELAASQKITAGTDPDRPRAVDLYGAFHGSRADAARLVEELVGHVGADPTAAAMTSMTWPRTRKFWAELGNPAEESGRPSVPSRPSTMSLREVEFFARPPPGRGGRRAAGGSRRRTDRRGVPRAGLHALGRRLQPPAARRHRLRPPRPALPAQARRGGGPRRPGGPGRGPSGGHPVVGIGPPWGSGRVFQNFADPDLEHWAQAYYGPNYDRLVLGQGTVRPSEPLPLPAVTPHAGEHTPRRSMPTRSRSWPYASLQESQQPAPGTSAVIQQSVTSGQAESTRQLLVGQRDQLCAVAGAEDLVIARLM